MQKTKNEEGITLIALVTTIIVLLILAGISIGAITGNNGIVNQAQNAKDDTQYSQWEEQIDTAIIDAESKHRNPTMDDVIDELINKEIISDESQVDKKTGDITTNEPSYVIKDKLRDYIEPFKPGQIASENEIYIDKNGDKVTIPSGFEILPNAEVIEEGLVIQDENGNQFVWIPVQIPVANSEEEGTTNKAMAIKNENNYIGLLYDFTSNGSTVINGCTTSTNSDREPDLIIYDNRNGLFTKDDLQNEYNKMMTSVEKYNGFYIGRYELGLEENNPVSKNAKENTNVVTAEETSASLDNWYGLYSKCKQFASEDSEKSVVSSMVWGSQYDAMMNWFTNKNINVTLEADGNNFIRNIEKVTGSEPKDKILNIFDLYGCHSEHTLEASGSNGRTERGGNSYYFGHHPLCYRSGYVPNQHEEYNSSRITLYIK